MKALVVLSGLAIAIVMPGAAVAGDPSGTWLTANGKSNVRVYACGAGFCGKIVKLSEPLDAAGKPKVDRHNKNASLRGRKIVGINIMNGMKPTKKPDQWKGNIYNPEDGKTYTGYMTLKGSTLKVEGCVAAIFCKSQDWKKL